MLGHYFTDPYQAIVIVVECYSVSFALQVDEILGQHQVVIKPLHDNFMHHQSLAGSAILGDWQVGLILDPNRLADSSDINVEEIDAESKNELAI